MSESILGVSAEDLRSLTPREHEVFVLVAEGKTLLEIAQHLNRSLKTIESHRLAVGRKLKVSNRIELVKIALAAGLISLPEPIRDLAIEEWPGQSDAAMTDPQVRRWYRAVMERVYDKAGPGYVKELACALSDVLKASYAGTCVPEQESDTAAIFRSLASSHDGLVADQFSYPQANTPSRRVIAEGSVSIERGIANEYPLDAGLPKIEADAYIALRLEDHSGEPVGLLWVVDKKERTDAKAILDLLRLFQRPAAAMVIHLRRAEQTLKLCESRGKQLEIANRSLKNKNTQLDQIAGYYTALAERMSDGLIVLDEKKRIEFTNQKLADIVGRAREALTGLKVDDILTTESAKNFHAMQPERERDQLKHYETQVQRPDGSTRAVFVSPRSLFDEQGQFVGSFAVVTDRADIESVEQAT